MSSNAPEEIQINKSLIAEIDRNPDIIIERGLDAFEEELNKPSSKVTKGVTAFEKLLKKEEKFFNRIIQNFTPDKNGEIKGLGIVTAARAVALFIRHPVSIFRIARLYLSSKEIKSQAAYNFLNNDTIWNFIKSKADQLPQLGQTLSTKFEMSEFKDGGILDKKALDILKEVFNKEQNLNIARNALLEYTNPNSDIKKVVNHGLNLLTIPEFSHYFSEKGLAIRDYLKSKEYVQKNLNIYQLDKEVLGLVPNLVTKLPELKDIWTKLENDGFAPAVFEALHTVNKDKVLSDFFKENPQTVSNVIKAVIEQNKGLKKITEEFKFDPKLLDISDIILAKPELAKKLTLLFYKEDFPKLIKTLATELENPKFADYVKNNRAEIAKLVEGLQKQVPSIEARLSPKIKLTELIEAILEEPQKLTNIIQAYEDKKWIDLFKGGKSILSLDFIESLFEVSKNVATIILPKISDKMLEISFDKTLDRFKTKQLDGQILKELLPFIREGQISLSGKILSGNLANLDCLNIDFEDCDLSKVTSLNNVNFRESDLSNAILPEPMMFASANNIDTAKFPKHFIRPNVVIANRDIVDSRQHQIEEQIQKSKVKDDSINKNSLKILLPFIREGQINLYGKKLTGNLANLNLSNINFAGCDLTEVTSFDNANFKNSDFRNAILPDAELFASANNIDEAQFPTNFINQNIVSINNRKLAERAVKNVIALKEREETSIKMEDKELLTKIFRNIISGDSIFAKYLLNQLQEAPDKKFPIIMPVDNGQKKPKKAGNVVNKVRNLIKENTGVPTTPGIFDYTGTEEILSCIYNSVDKPDALYNKLAANLIAIKITKFLVINNIHPETYSYEIKKALEENLEQYINTIPKFDFALALDDETELKKFAENYITTLTNDELKEDIKYAILQSFSKYSLTSKEEEITKNIAQKIGKNLFGDGIRSDRATDLQIITYQVKNALFDLKSRHRIENVENGLELKFTNIVGGTYTKSGLTQEFRDVCRRTTAGILTGGICLDETKINKQFKTTLSEVLYQYLMQNQRYSNINNIPKTGSSDNGRGL